MIALEDLKDKTEQEIIEHLASNYSGNESGYDYGEIDETDIEKAKNDLKDMAVLVAYESVGSWGCDSSSFFLLKHKETEKLFEVHGSHCSCYGFEGQLQLEETNIEALKHRVKNGGNVFYCGGYDENKTENQKIVNSFIEAL